VRRPYLRERDTGTNLEFDEKGETDEEELVQTESEHYCTAEQEEQTPASASNNFKDKIFRGTQKRPWYQRETASAVLMKYLVESDKKSQAEHTVDPVDTFLKEKHCSNSKTFFLLIIKTFASEEYLRLYLKWK